MVDFRLVPIIESIVIGRSNLRPYLFKVV